MAREIKTWTVRNKSGQHIARYRAHTADQAIGRLMDDQAQTAATFRRGQPLSIKRTDFTASVEP